MKNFDEHIGLKARPTPPPPMGGWPGGKAASGLCERIIRQMPPHVHYCEPFAGLAAVFRRKRPSTYSLLIDEADSACVTLQAWIDASDVRGACVLRGNALDLIPTQRAMQDPRTLLYADPPYLLSTRTRLLYDHEFGDESQHASLLTLLLQLPCMVMISGYASPLYASMLEPRWRRLTIPAMTRGGMRDELLWCNFPEPTALHDPRFAGGNFRERERIKRKARRWVTRYMAMDPRERQAVATELAKSDPHSLEAALTAVTDAPGGIAGVTGNRGDERSRKEDA